MQAPVQIVPTSLSDYLESMSRAVFNAGISWKVIEAKWPSLRQAFEGFDVQKIAAFTPLDVERLMTDTRVIRNRKKLDAIVANAGELILTEREFGSIANYFASFPDTEALIKDLHRRFAFLGESTARYFLYSVSFKPAEQEKWAHGHFSAMHGGS
jgi:DNA-3-methyladenine glycosylase I